MCSTISVFIQLPLGKPNPSQQRMPGIDARERVAQAAQKSLNTCWYAASNLLRERYGKDPDPSLRAEREIEKLISSYRKDLTKSEQISSLHETFMRIGELVRTSLSPEGQRLVTTTRERLFSSDRPQQGRPGPIPSFRAAPPQRGTTLPANVNIQDSIALYQEFRSQSAQPAFDLFLADKRVERDLKIQQTFLEAFEVDPAKKYQEEYALRRSVSWENLEPLGRRANLNNLIFRMIAQQVYHFTPSAWNPTQPIDSLIQELSAHGPFLINGCFGRILNTTEPVSMGGEILEKTVWFWPPDAIKATIPVTQSFVLVGASADPRRLGGGTVFFVDPMDGSDPAKPNQQRLYAMSYQRLRENITNLYGEYDASLRNNSNYDLSCGYAFQKH